MVTKDSLEIYEDVLTSGQLLAEEALNFLLTSSGQMPLESTVFPSEKPRLSSELGDDDWDLLEFKKQIVAFNSLCFSRTEVISLDAGSLSDMALLRGAQMNQEEVLAIGIVSWNCNSFNKAR